MADLVGNITMAPNDIRLGWVLADPSSERAVDALGMGAQADQIADFLLPQLSGRTSRARYFSFFCWAVRKSKGYLPLIHKLEAELAIEEAQRHEDDSSNACPGVVGRSRALKYIQEHNGNPPPKPERLYKNTAFAAYRPTLRGLGLLTNDRSPHLTDEGDRLASLFEKHRGCKPRCLSGISKPERVQIKALLGLDYRKRTGLALPSERRRATYETVHHELANGNSASVLERHSQSLRRHSPVAEALHRAFVWEVLSCGLTLALVRLLWKGSVEAVAKEIEVQFGRHPRRSELQEFQAQSDDSPRQIVALLRTATISDPVRLKLEQEPFELAKLLVTEPHPRRFLQALVERHRSAKGDAPWVTLFNGKVKVLATEKNLPDHVQLRSYRLDAFKQLLLDLELIP
jgi:hypothetical protein